MSLPNNALFVGCEHDIRSDWSTLVPNVAVPKNLKDPEKIAQAREAAILGLRDMPVLAAHTEVVVLDADANVVIHATTNAIELGPRAKTLQLPSGMLLEIATNPSAALLAIVAGTCLNSLYDQRPSVFGFDIYDELRIAGMAVGDFLQRYGIHPSIWRAPTGRDCAACDPYAFALPAEVRKQVSLDALCQRLVIDVPRDSAYGKAAAAREVAMKLNIVGS